MASFDSCNEAQLFAQIAQGVQLGADIIELNSACEHLIPAINLSLSSIKPRDTNQVYPPKIQIFNNDTLVSHIEKDQDLGKKIAIISRLNDKIQANIQTSPAILRINELADIELAWSCVKMLKALNDTP